MELAVGDVWAFRRFGVLGKSLRSRVLSTIIDCHNEHANAQMQIHSTHKRAYGSVSYTFHERLFEDLAGLESVEFKRPGKGKPRVLVVNDTLIVLWRYANNAKSDLPTRKYANSDSRVNTFSVPTGGSQGVLDLGDGVGASLTSEELELVEQLRNIEAAEPRLHHRVVVIAYASDAKDLHKVVWADATLNDDGTLLLENTQEIHRADSPEMTAFSSPKRFDTQPRRDFGLLPKKVSE